MTWTDLRRQVGNFVCDVAEAVYELGFYIRPPVDDIEEIEPDEVEQAIGRPIIRPKEEPDGSID